MQIAQAPEPAGGSIPPELRGTAWRWVGVTSPPESFTVDQPDRYTLSFIEGDKVALRADCNRGIGSVASSSPGALAIGPLAMTRARCPPGSLSDRFARDVSRAIRFLIRGDELQLELPADAGVLRFVRGS
jgi:para-nitrobenzyl esterase